MKKIIPFLGPILKKDPSGELGLGLVLPARQTIPEVGLLKRIDIRSAHLVFTGWAEDQSATTAQAKWIMKREIIVGNEVITEWASNTFDQIWDNRDSLFSTIPFVNNFSVQFDGNNDFIDVDDNSLIDFDFESEAASWNFWIKSTDTSGTVEYIEKMLSNTGYRLSLASNRLTIELRATGTGDRIRVRSNVNVTYRDGNWHMVTITYDGSGDASGVTMYVDGASIVLNTQNDTLTGDTSNIADMAIAARSGGSGANFGPGNLDEVSIWNDELLSADVTALYNSGVPIDLQNQSGTIETALVYWNRMGDGPNDVFPTLEDVENNIIGTMTNMSSGDIESEVP